MIQRPWFYETNRRKTVRVFASPFIIPVFSFRVCVFGHNNRPSSEGFRSFTIIASSDARPDVSYDDAVPSACNPCPGDGRHSAWYVRRGINL